MVGDSVCALSKITSVIVDHRWKTEFYINGALILTDESGWLNVENGWDYSSAMPIITNVQSGNGAVKVWLDTGNGYELLSQKYFTVVDNSVSFVYAGSQSCEGWENGSTDPSAPNYWDLQAVNPGDSFSEGGRVYLLAQAEDVSVDHEWKMEVFHGGVYQWEYLSGWLDLNGSLWDYSNFPPYIDNVSAGTYELKVYLRTDGDFEYLDSNVFNVSALPVGTIPFSADFELHDYGFYLEDNTGVGDGNIIRTIDSGRNCLELSNSGQADESWKIQAKKVGLDFISETDYSGSIWLKGETAGTVYVAVEKNTDPWTNLGMWKALNITTTWTEYNLDFTFVGEVDPADVRFTIQFGNYQGKFWIDDLVFDLESDPPVPPNYKIEAFGADWNQTLMIAFDGINTDIEHYRVNVFSSSTLALSGIPGNILSDVLVPYGSNFCQTIDTSSYPIIFFTVSAIDHEGQEGDNYVGYKLIGNVTDTDNDGISFASSMVNFSDYNTLRAYYYQPVTHRSSDYCNDSYLYNILPFTLHERMDYNIDGMVDGTEYNLFRAVYGRTGAGY